MLPAWRGIYVSVVFPSEFNSIIVAKAVPFDHHFQPAARTVSLLEAGSWRPARDPIEHGKSMG
jgi:hypothetical protein